MEELILEVNELRKTLLKRFWIGLTVAIVLLILIFIILPILSRSSTVVGFVILGITGIGFMVYYDKLNREFKEIYKEDIVKRELRKVFDEVDYTPGYGFSKEQIQNAYLVNMGNRFFSDDLLKAKYHGIEFKRSDVKIQNVQKTGKTTTTVTYFEGQWITFEFAKKILNYTIIKEKEFLSNSKPGGFFSGAPTCEKILFEDEMFNKQFIVYSSDGQEAFYILTPQFMERIKDIEARFEGRVYFGFQKNKFHIAIDDRKNRFEASLFNGVTDYKIRELKNQIEGVKELIELVKDYIQ